MNALRGFAPLFRARRSRCVSFGGRVDRSQVSLTLSMILFLFLISSSSLFPLTRIFKRIDDFLKSIDDIFHFHFLD